MNVQESIAALRADLSPGGFLWQKGVRFEPGAPVPRLYVSEDPDRGTPLAMAMDAVPALQSDPNSGVPMQFLNYVDPQVYEFLFAPLLVAEAPSPPDTPYARQAADPPPPPYAPALAVATPAALVASAWLVAAPPAPPGPPEPLPPPAPP